MKAETLKKYMGDRLTVDQIKQAIALINGKADPMQYESVQKWVSQCYNKPPEIDKILEALNEVLEGYGTEPLRGAHVDGYHWDCQAVYINFGDTYTPTIIYDNVKDKFLVSSWGDFVEPKPKRFPQE